MGDKHAITHETIQRGDKWVRVLRDGKSVFVLRGERVFRVGEGGRSFRWNAEARAAKYIEKWLNGPMLIEIDEKDLEWPWSGGRGATASVGANVQTSEEPVS